MALEYLSPRAVTKPWGSTDLRPWSDMPLGGEAVGELWFERPGAPESALLLKLLFTTQALSIQVHPDDAYARSIGLPHGKPEAWYIISEAPDRGMGLGLKWQLTASQFRKAIGDGSIADLVQWRRVEKDDVILVPAGTIHTIGAGLVIAEIQQQSDATFRIFDYSRTRELHVDRAFAAASPSPATWQPVPTKLADARSLLVGDPHFIFERLDLLPHSNWRLDAERETWLFVMRGSARIGSFDVSTARAIFAEDERTTIDVGESGLKLLAAYAGGAIQPDLLRRCDISPDAAETALAVRPLSQSPDPAVLQAG